MGRLERIRSGNQVPIHDGAPSTPLSYSTIPCGYSIGGLLQDTTGAIDTISNGVWAPQGSNYRIRLSWTPVSGDAAGRLLFRLQEYLNYYSLDFYVSQVGLSLVVNGVLTDIMRAYRPIDPQHPALFTLTMAGVTFTVKDNAQPGSPTILTWTDPNNHFPVGVAVSHDTDAYRIARWDYAVGTPT